MRWLAVLAVAVLLQQPVAAAVVQEHVQRPYPVHAQPGQSLRQALHVASPIVVAGRQFHGYTRWQVRWSYRWWREASGRCTITEVTTRLSTEVQLPQLHSATPQQRAVFDRYLRALAQHEQGHAQFGRDAAHAIDQGIARLPAAADCATLERDADALGRRLLKEYVQQEEEYDRSTGHGASQGARLD